VTVVQQPSADADTTPTKPIDNEDWARKGAEWLTATHGVSGSAAIAALTKYISGTDRTFDEQTLVDMVIKEKGQPPNSIAEGGSVSAAPAKKQFSNFPGKHVIKGGSDNGFPQLATLYYGSAVDDRIDLLQAANPSLGTSGPVGGRHHRGHPRVPRPRVLHRHHRYGDDRQPGRRQERNQLGPARSPQRPSRWDLQVHLPGRSGTEHSG
jgi:hypothetical protein